MSRRVRLVTGAVDRATVARAPVRQLPRTISSRRGPAKPAGPAKVRCVCGRSLPRQNDGKIQAHKDPRTTQWCSGGAAPKPQASSEPRQPASGASDSRSDARPSPERGALRTKGTGRKAPRRRPGPGQARCIRCGRWFAAQEGNTVPRHDAGGDTPCKGSGKRALETTEPSVRARRGKRGRSAKPPTPRPQDPMEPRDTADSRADQRAERKRRDRVELAMLELDDRPARDDLEFGPGRDPRVRGGLSQTRRSRY